MTLELNAYILYVFSSGIYACNINRTPMFCWTMDPLQLLCICCCLLQEFTCHKTLVDNISWQNFIKDSHFVSCSMQCYTKSGIITNLKYKKPMRIYSCIFYTIEYSTAACAYHHTHIYCCLNIFFCLCMKLVYVLDFGCCFVMF
jgi:hypothetical protein